MHCQVKMYSCSFMDEVGGYNSDAILCLQWCASKGVHMTSNSWAGGISRDGDPLYREIEVSCVD